MLNARLNRTPITRSLCIVTAIALFNEKGDRYARPQKRLIEALAKTFGVPPAWSADGQRLAFVTGHEDPAKDGDAVELLRTAVHYVPGEARYHAALGIDPEEAQRELACIAAVEDAPRVAQRLRERHLRRQVAGAELGVGLGLGDFVAVPPGVAAGDPHAVTTTVAAAVRRSVRRFIAHHSIGLSCVLPCRAFRPRAECGTCFPKKRPPSTRCGP